MEVALAAMAALTGVKRYHRRSRLPLDKSAFFKGSSVSLSEMNCKSVLCGQE